jgi:UDP-N-acetyl-D-glucosamine dehydrogenase
VIRLLEERGADVVHHDPFIPRFDDGDHDGGPHRERIGVDLSAEELRKADAVVIVTDHSQIDYQQIVDDAILVIDTRNATARASRGRARVVSLAADRGRRLARWAALRLARRRRLAEHLIRFPLVAG